MSKEIICVYQDCVLCGDRGKKLKQLIFDKNLNVRKVSFASPEGQHLIHEAIFVHKIGTLPLFVKGDRFSNNIEDLLKRAPRKTNKSKKSKKSKKKEEVIENEHMDES